MSDRVPGQPGFLPGTVWTRADAVQVGDRVFIRQDDEDLWALVIAIAPIGDPAKVRLKLILELDGVPVRKHVQTPTKGAVYMRCLSVESRGVPGRLRTRRLGDTARLKRVPIVSAGFPVCS